VHRLLLVVIVCLLVVCEKPQQTAVVTNDPQGRVRFNVEPASTKIYLPGLQRELTQHETLAIGRYRVEFSAPNYQTERIWLDVSAGDDLQIDMTLNKQVAELRLDVWPPGAELSWRDKQGVKQNLPVQASIDVEIGQYQLTFSKAGYQAAQVTLDVTEKRPYELTVRLTPVQRKVGEVFTDKLLEGTEGPSMVVVPAGRFTQGDIVGDGDWQELPIRQVSISKPFAIGQTEVTCADYRHFITALKRVMPSCQGDDYPISQVSWQDATAYAKWLSIQTGEVYRLPSESEWEYTARAGSEDNYSVGSSIDCDQARFGGLIICESSQAVPVMQYPANAFGLFDMHGNLWEWTQDCATEDYTDAPLGGTAVVTEPCHRSMLRGGSYMLNAHKLRVSYRSWRFRDYRHADTGFRLVREL